MLARPRHVKTLRAVCDFLTFSCTLPVVFFSTSRWGGSCTCATNIIELAPLGATGRLVGQGSAGCRSEREFDCKGRGGLSDYGLQHPP